MLVQRISLLSSLASDPAAWQWRNAVVANGGTVSTAQLGRVATMIRQMRATPAWGLLDDAWIPVAESSIQALTSLKQNRLATPVNSPTFTAGQGYAFDGATNYIDTGFIMASHCVAGTGSGFHGSVFELTNVNSNTVSFGGTNTATRSLDIFPRAGASNFSMNVNSNKLASSVAPTTSVGLSLVQRTSGTTAEGWQNGVQASFAAPSSNGTTLLPTSLYIGANNATGVAGSFRPTTVGFASVGGIIPSTAQLAFYNAVRNYMLAWGLAV